MPNKFPPLQSGNAQFDAPGFEAVKTDLKQIVTRIGDAQDLYLSGAERVMAPAQGLATCFMASDTATVSSSTNYHIFKVLRGGQDESGISIDTRVNELAAYKEYCLGQVFVGQGGVLKVDIAVTGAPVPTLSVANITLRCVLSPRM